jgi:plastocyanin
MFGREATKQTPNLSRSSGIFRRVLLLAALIIPQVVHADQWNAIVGGQSSDKGHQALAFLPNEIWIHAGDRITWLFDVDEIHTVTFLASGQVRPFFAAGCPGFSSDPATFDGSTCVTTPPMVLGQTFTVIFPNAGNFKLTCLVHENMDGTIHVLAPSEPLPHDQAFYDQQGIDERTTLLSEPVHRDHHNPVDPRQVTAGIGKVAATAGGTSTLSIVRFQHGTTEIHAGQTVEWNNLDPVLPHTITFGPVPADLQDPSPDVTVDADGARHAVIHSPSDSTHSGFIVAAPQERLGLPQAPLGFTRFRVTFPNAGVFFYICALHDTLGMTGKVIVRP